MSLDLRRIARTIRYGYGSTVAAVRSHDPRLATRVAACAAVNVIQLIGGRVIRRRSCPCCGWSGCGFLWSANEIEIVRDAICPNCQSRSRHRALVLLVPERVHGRNVRDVLHFAPEPQLLPGFRTLLADARYSTTDLNRTDVDLSGQDIQRLDLPDDSFDLVLCNHVLEHVEDDAAAMAEIARVLRPGGQAIITIPGDWSTLGTISFEVADPNGHWRHYGSDARDRLANAFELVEAVPSGSIGNDPRHQGLVEAEPVFVCCHPSDAAL